MYLIFEQNKNNNIYEGDLICNYITLKTQSTNALEFYTIYGTIDQGLAFQMVHKILFYLSYLFSYRLLKMHTYIVLNPR